jgi:tRNA(Ile)-lysidine synthase
MILDRELLPVERALAASLLVPCEGFVIVSVSGGADSMALVDALLNAAPRVLSPMLAHFDHRLRADSARDAEHVEAYARTHGLEFELGSEDVARRARSQRRSIEEAARDARYQFLTATAVRLGASCVVTAHTRSDQVETILMRILRGTGRAGLAGIPERRGMFVRPLLEVTHGDTRAYCTRRGIAFVDDPSNDDLRFFRNRVRHEILPALRAAYPAVDHALLRLADSARREQRAFAARTDGLLDEVLREEETSVWTLRLDAFETLDDDDATALLHDALARIGLARDVGRVHYARMLELVRDEHAGSSASLPGFSARREHDALVLRARGWRTTGAHKREESSAKARTTRAQWAVVRQDPRAALEIPGRTQLGAWTVEAEFVAVDDARAAIAARHAGGDVAYFDADAIDGRLVARPVKWGDAMRPFGLGGRKKLSDLFVDRKVPRRHRERAIAIEAESILWVPGLATSQHGSVGPATARVVRLKATRA